MSDVTSTIERPPFPHDRSERVFGRHSSGVAAATVISSKRGALAYVPAPKNACTSLKLLFWDINMGRPFKGKFWNIHEKFNYYVADFEAFARDTAHYKFTVVRDPLERFVSAYNNRVLMYGELSEDWFLARLPDQAAMLAYMRSRSLRFDPPLGEFIQRLEEYLNVSITIRHHFIPQTMHIHGDVSAYDRIYNIRELADLERDISERIDRPIKLPMVQETKGLKNPARASDIGAHERDILTRFYAADFAAFSAFFLIDDERCIETSERGTLSAAT